SNMSTAFSSDGSSLMEPTISEGATEHKPEINIERDFDVKRTIEWICINKYERVALQFPDELLCYSASIVGALRQATSALLFILGDTSYGSCCVDEVAGEHHKADALVHYGHSCLSQTGRLPVLFIFGQRPIDVEHCTSVITSTLNDAALPVVLMYDVAYRHAIGLIETELGRFYETFVCSSLNLPESESNSISSKESQDTVHSEESQSARLHTKCGRTFKIPEGTNLGDFTICFIGSSSLTMTNIRMVYNQCQLYSYNPESMECNMETPNSNKLLMKRYVMVEKAKDASIVGIVMGTLGIKDYLQTLDRMKHLCKITGKKTYTFSMGKINVAKLANFLEIDVFVLISCAENTLLDSKEFYKPIVTPYEMELACNENLQWTGEYETDFRQLNKIEISEEPRKLEHDVSIITGKIRTLGVEEVQNESSGALLSRDEALTLATQDAGANFLHSRQWQGLEQKLGETEVVKAVKGQTGIAMSYTDGAGGDNTQPR
ncbi:unnamed protein product, partial [Owenia fusiformis]